MTADHDPATVELVARVHAAAWGLQPREPDREVARAVVDALAAAGWRDLSRVSGYLVDGEIYQPRDVEILTKGGTDA